MRGVQVSRSERNGVSGALLPTNSLFGALLDAAPDAVVIADEGGRIVLVNARTQELFGYTRDELVGGPIEVLLPESIRAAHGSHRAHYAARPEVRQMGAGLDLSGRRKDGSEFPVDVSLSPLRTEDGLLILASVRDVSERRRAEEALRQSERRFRNSFELAPIGMALVSTEGRFLQVNDSLAELLGYPAEELLSKTFQEITHPDDLDLDLDYLRRTMADEIRSYQMEKRYFHRLGHTVWVLLAVSLVRASDGTPLHFVSQIEDITGRKEADQRLAEAELRHRTLIEKLPIGMYIRPLDLTKPNVYASPQVEPMLGYPAEEWQTNPDLLASIVHPDDRERVLGAAAHVRRTGEPLHDEYRYIHRDGHVVWVQDETHVVEDDDGKPAYVQGFLFDITERKRAEADRDGLRDELHRAQKLDAIGRLAGGIAHDFNNMLTAIKGYSELLLDGLDPADPLRSEAEQIKRAAEQGAALPRQLLAFSRNQVLEPKLVDLNRVLSETAVLMRRMVSEAVELVTLPAAQSPGVMADASQIEQLLLNLAVNARHAMPDGGTLTIATRDAQVDEAFATQHQAAPGAYVVLAAADSGVGMDEETKARAFEPFFTTKPPGEGSGLGLATVYGIVKQSGGFIILESEPERGAIFELYFPSATGPQAAGANGAEPAPRARTVLLAEDEDLVRELVQNKLERAGYRVIAARDGNEALAAYAASNGDVDLLLTDMVMPGLGGHGLAQRAHADNPDLPMVFMSGYTHEAPPVGPDGASIGTLLHKPFSTHALVACVEQALEPASPVEPEGRRITCVVADDHPAILDSVSRYLEGHGIDVVARTTRGDEAIAAIAVHRPTIALLDVTMQPLSGIEVARKVANAAYATSSVLYTGRREDLLVEQALDAGARGFVLKEGSLEELVRALHTVADGGTYVDPSLSRTVVSPRALHGVPPLTNREREVLALVADGLTNDKAAAELGISAETVQSHVRNAMTKLDADSRTQAVATALRQSLIS